MIFFVAEYVVNNSESLFVFKRMFIFNLLCSEFSKYVLDQTYKFCHSHSLYSYLIPILDMSILDKDILKSFIIIMDNMVSLQNFNCFFFMNLKLCCLYLI